MPASLKRSSLTPLEKRAIEVAIISTAQALMKRRGRDRIKREDIRDAEAVHGYFINITNPKHRTDTDD